MRASAREPLPALEEERELDLGRYGRALAARWWLPLAGILAGVAIGSALSLGTAQRYRAQAIVYLGEPLAPAAGAPVSSAPTQLALVSELVRSESTIRRVGARAGLRPRQLRGRIEAKPLLGVTTGKLGTPAPLLSITVRGSAARKVAVAANTLAAIVIARTSGYVEVKIGVLKARLAYEARQIASLRRRLALARKGQQAILANKRFGGVERLVSLLNFNSLITAEEGRLFAFEDDHFAARQVLTLAEVVERGRIVTPALASREPARGRASSLAVAGIIGLIVGILAALLWEPLAAARAGSSDARG
jgi:uncharacterized protein involved in exopolysaccharide biosynthesis